jgi:hypothetical protein
MKSLHLIGLVALAGATLHGQSATQPIYWSTTQPDCSSLNNETPFTVTDPSLKATLGYSCWVSGTFLWLAAGGEWSTAIRAAAPASGAVAVYYSFYDVTGASQSLDTTGSLTASSNEVDFALYANQPSELDLLGATSDRGTRYSSTATGAVSVMFLCPDATTCGNVMPQLLYSALPSYPWSLSVPIAWAGSEWTQWSGVGYDDGTPEHRVSLAISNADTVSTTYTVSVYDSTGTLAGTATTASIPSGENLGGGVYGPGGSIGVLLSDLFPGLPADLYKILVDGGTKNSLVEMLQIDGLSATTLQVAYDSAPSTTSTATARRQSVSKLRVVSTPRPVVPGLPKQNRSR